MISRSFANAIIANAFLKGERCLNYWKSTVLSLGALYTAVRTLCIFLQRTSLKKKWEGFGYAMLTLLLLWIVEFLKKIDVAESLAGSAARQESNSELMRTQVDEWKKLLEEGKMTVEKWEELLKIFTESPFIKLIELLKEIATGEKMRQQSKLLQQITAKVVAVQSCLQVCEEKLQCQLGVYAQSNREYATLNEQLEQAITSLQQIPTKDGDNCSKN